MATLTLKANGSTAYDTSLWINTEQAYDNSTSTYASPMNPLSYSNINNAPIGFLFDTSAIPTGSVVSSITINIMVKQPSSTSSNRLTIAIQDSGKNTLGTTTELSNVNITTLTRTVMNLDQISCVWVVPTIGTGSNNLYIYDVSATIEYEEQYEEQILIAQYKYDKSIYDNLIPEFNSEFNDYIVADNEPEIVDFRSRLAFGHTDDAGMYYKPIYLDNGDIEFSCSAWDVCRIDISEHLGKFITVSFNFANKPGWCELAVRMGNFNETIISEWYEEADTVNSNCALPIRTSTTSGDSEILIEGMNIWLWNISIMTEDGIELFPINMKEEYAQSADKNYHTPDLVYDNELNFSNIWNAMYIDINNCIGKEVRLTFDILGLPNDNGWTEFEYCQFDGTEWHEVDGSMNHIIYANLSEATTVHCDSTMTVDYDYLYIGGMGGRISNLKIEVINPNTENIITRSIYAHELPTLMRFGAAGSSNSRSQSLLEVNYVNADNLDTMYCMFDECNNVRTINTENWNTSNVTNMEYMFCSCYLLTSIEGISNWNTINVTNMEYMFYECQSLTSVGDLSNWDVSNVIDMGLMFSDCTSLTSLDISNWDTSNVTDMNYMFWGCCSLTSIGDLSNWDVSNVTTMKAMFYDCESLTSLNLSNWDTSNVTNMVYISEDESYYGLFEYCKSLISLDLSNWDTSNVTNMNYMFDSCYSLTSLDLSGWNVSNVTTMNSMFYDCESLTSLDVSNWDTSNVTDMYCIFGRCYELNSIIGIENWDVSNVTNMNSMFFYCKISELDLSNWNVSNVTNMAWMFSDCYMLQTLNVTGWDTSNVATMNQMFSYYEIGNHNLRNIIGINTWDVSNVTSMYCVFWECRSLESLDLSNWDVSNVTDMSWIFCDCESLETLNLDGWHINENAKYNDLFSSYEYDGCKSLTSVSINDSDYNSVNKVIAELPTRTATSPGVLDILGADIIDQVNVSTARNKYWEVIAIHNAVKNVYIGNTQINTLFLQKDKKIKGIYFGDNKLY